MISTSQFNDLILHLARSGERSVYGDLTVQLLGEDGAEQTIGLVRGLAVYSPNRSRIVPIPIDPSFAPRAETLVGSTA